MQYWFFAYPNREIGLNDLCVEVEISKTTANRVVSLLEKEKFLQIQKFGRVWRIKADNQHAFMLTRKMPFHLNAIYESNIVAAIRNVLASYNAVVLFGSYRKGDDTETSDLDIAVEVVDDQGMEIMGLGSIDLGYRKNVPIHLHVFSRNKIDLNVFANIMNGIVLDGFLEVKP